MSLYKQHPDGPWWANITHDGERIRRTTGTTDRKEAQRVHDELKATLWKETPRLKGKTWGDAVLAWCGKQERSESELLSLKKFSRYFSDRLLTQVTREAVHNALSSFCESAGTYTRYRTMIAAILNVAKAEGWLREVPVLATRTEKTKTRDWITHDQWTKLHAELPRHLRPMAAFAVQTGLRQSNVLGLVWSRVDANRRLVWIEAEDTKADKALGIPLSDAALEVLAAQRVKGAHPEYVFTYRGKPIKKIRTGFQAAAIRAGLGSLVLDGESYRYQGFTWHGLRHTWATWHVQAGTPLGVLQVLGGWSDIRMCMKYAHHAPDHVASYANNATLQYKARPLPTGDEV